MLLPKSRYKLHRLTYVQRMEQKMKGSLKKNQF